MISENSKTRRNILALSGILALTAMEHQAHAGSCRVAATKCEVTDMIEKAKFGPQPVATAANVSIVVYSQSSIYPSNNGNSSTFNFAINNTITAFSNQNVISVSCTPAPYFALYPSTIKPQSNALFGKDSKDTKVCPAGGLSADGKTLCANPIVITVNLTASGTNFIGTAADTNYSAITYTTTNSGVMGYVSGYYTCTYTDPTLGTQVTQYVPWPVGF